jgi:hypothetical protein
VLDGQTALAPRSLIDMALQLESLGLLKRGSYKIAGGGYSKLNPSNLDIFEEFKNIDVIHLPSVRPDGPEVAAALKGKGKGGSCGVNEYLEAVDVEPELATQILKHQVICWAAGTPQGAQVLRAGRKVESHGYSCCV